MSSSANTEKVAEGNFSACSGPDWCPHTVQVALATDRMGTPRKDGGAIMSRNVIATREVAATVGGGLFNQAWKPWNATVPRGGDEGARKWCAHKTNVAEC